jgi:hypothetical protein
LGAESRDDRARVQIAATTNPALKLIIRTEAV